MQPSNETLPVAASETAAGVRYGSYCEETNPAFGITKFAKLIVRPSKRTLRRPGVPDVVMMLVACGATKVISASFSPAFGA